MTLDVNFSTDILVVSEFLTANVLLHITLAR